MTISVNPPYIMSTTWSNDTTELDSYKTVSNAAWILLFFILNYKDSGYIAVLYGTIRLMFNSLEFRRQVTVLLCPDNT